jgi:hypothetical protein
MKHGDTIDTPTGRGRLLEIDYRHGFALVDIMGQGKRTFALSEIGAQPLADEYAAQLDGLSAFRIQAE